MGERASATTLASELSPEELAHLIEVLRRAKFSGPHLEIGTAAGGTLCEMMKCFSDAERPRFVVVDPMGYFPNQLEAVKANLRQHGLGPARVDFRVSKSFPAFQRAEAASERFDFIFIDGAHKVRYVTQDLCWTRLLRPGGIVCLHDYNDRHKGVKWTADRFLRRRANYRRESLVSNLLVVKKESPSAAPEIDAADRLWAALLAPLLQLELSLSKRLRKRG